MAIIKSCCCWRSLRKGCYAAAIYTAIYFSITIMTMGHFLEMEYRYLQGNVTEPESESFLEPEKVTPVTVSLNITLLVCSSMGMFSCFLLIHGVKRDIKYLLLPWLVVMVLETVVEVINLIYLLYLQSMDFNPITSFLFTMDFFIIVLNLYAMVCVISQLQEYMAGRGTAAHDDDDMVAVVHYTAATAQQTTTTSSAPSGRRRSAARPMPSRIDPEDPSEIPPRPMTSALSKAPRSTVKKHVQFPDEQSCIQEAPEIQSSSDPEPESEPEDKPEGQVISSLWMELETTPIPER